MLAAIGGWEGGVLPVELHAIETPTIVQDCMISAHYAF
jgi:hypothetical protein